MKLRAFSLLGALFCFSLLAGEERLSKIEDADDIWYRAFLKVFQSAEHFIEAGEPEDGMTELTQAFLYLKILALEHPEFQSEIVKEQLQLVAEKQHRLATGLQNTESRAVEKLEHELNELNARLRRLKDRRKELDKELEEFRKPETGAEVGFQIEGLEPLSISPERPSFHDRLDDGDEGLFSKPPILSELFPNQYDHAPEDQTKRTGAHPAFPIPKNWIPRFYDGQMTYLIPLLKTSGK
ncbi:MAG: hypothetical protein WD342_14545 [Verrucomicrobiales bacterium]